MDLGPRNVLIECEIGGEITTDWQWCRTTKWIDVWTAGGLQRCIGEKGVESAGMYYIHRSARVSQECDWYSEHI